MYRITPAVQHYAWGSTTAIPDVLALVPDGRPVAEAWFGAHPSAPATVQTADGPRGLDELIAADPGRHLGADVTSRFGAHLPYLLKIIAANAPLSLQVHPTLERARAGFAAEDAAGIPVSAARAQLPGRQPQARAGVRAEPARRHGRLPRPATGRGARWRTSTPRSRRTCTRCSPRTRRRPGVRTAFEWLLQPETRPGAADVAKFAEACARRLADGSPSPRTDRTVMRLAAAYPGTRAP